MCINAADADLRHGLHNSGQDPNQRHWRYARGNRSPPQRFADEPPQVVVNHVFLAGGKIISLPGRRSAAARQAARRLPRSDRQNHQFRQVGGMDQRKSMFPDRAQNGCPTCRCCGTSSAPTGRLRPARSAVGQSLWARGRPTTRPPVSGALALPVDRYRRRRIGFDFGPPFHGWPCRGQGRYDQQHRRNRRSAHAWAMFRVPSRFARKNCLLFKAEVMPAK